MNIKTIAENLISIVDLLQDVDAELSKKEYGLIDLTIKKDVDVSLYSMHRVLEKFLNAEQGKGE